MSKKPRPRPPRRRMPPAQGARVDRATGFDRPQRADGSPEARSNPQALARSPAIEERRAQPIDRAELAPAYDQGLLERARAQWRRGDWASLQELNAGEIEHHPDRARLALLAAAGHHALGQFSSARLLALRAAEWGCSRSLIARVLIGGVHNTLGRAAVAAGRQRDRALRHFELAVMAGAPGTTSMLAAQTRVEHQLGQMGMTTCLPQLRDASSQALVTSVAASPLKEIGDQLRKNAEALSTSVKTQHDNLIGARKYLEITIKREIVNATRQLEAFVNLQGYLTKGVVVPEMHGWPVSPDFALMLITMLEGGDYDLVIEFGSGTSTVLMATTLNRNSKRREGRARVVQVAFEHLDRYHAQTERQLAAAGLSDAVELQLAPLVPYRAVNGKSYSYYDCRPALATLAQTVAPPSKLRILVLVDGPPAATGEHARYPALSAVLEHFDGAHFDIVLDDYVRDDEKQIVQLWRADLEARGIEPTVLEKKLEKDACVLTF